MIKEKHLKDFFCCPTGVICAFSKTAHLLELTIISWVYRESSEKEERSGEQPLCGQKCLVVIRRLSTRGRLIQDSENVIVAQLSNAHNKGILNTVSSYPIGCHHYQLTTKKQLKFHKACKIEE